MSYFTPDAARSLPLAGPQRRLNSHGDNLGNVVQYMQREHPDRFKNILTKIADRIPGIDRIDTQQSPDGRLLLRFNDRGFQDPFYAQQMSDGTLKVFAYLLMLEDSQPPPFICIEEPENGLYHKLLEILAAEFRSHATGARNAPQIFVTTHQPYFVDALTPEETWVLEKQDDGFATIRRASDDNIVKAMVEEGLPLGSLWYSDYLDRRQAMHFEVLVEDQSGSIALDHILQKILGENGSAHDWIIHPFKGLGILPKYLNRAPNPRNWQLLEQLPSLLQGYGRSLPDSSVVLVVVDLDDKDCIVFKQDLLVC